MPGPLDYDVIPLVYGMPETDRVRIDPSTQRAFIGKAERTIQGASLQGQPHPGSGREDPGSFGARENPQATGMRQNKSREAVKKLTPEELEALAKQLEEEMKAQHMAMLATPPAVQPALDRPSYFPNF
jgi:hypothetical protein